MPYFLIISIRDLGSKLQTHVNDSISFIVDQSSKCICEHMQLISWNLQKGINIYLNITDFMNFVNNKCNNLVVNSSPTISFKV